MLSSLSIWGFFKYWPLIRWQNSPTYAWLVSFFKQVELSEGQHNSWDLWKSRQLRAYRCESLYYIKYLVRILILKRPIWIQGQNKEYGLNYNITRVKRIFCFLCSLRTAWTCFSQAEVKTHYRKNWNWGEARFFAWSKLQLTRKKGHVLFLLCSWSRSVGRAAERGRRRTAGDGSVGLLLQFQTPKKEVPISPTVLLLRFRSALREVPLKHLRHTNCERKRWWTLITLISIDPSI